MAIRQLSELIPDEGLKFIKFFNGRLLSGEDLSRDQASHREARRRTGLAVGSGIAQGLEVTVIDFSREKAAVRVAKGLALNRHGHTVALTEIVDLAIVPTRTVPPPLEEPRLFKDCEPISGVYVAGAGVYLLTIAPAEGEEGRAPVTGLANGHRGCNAKYLVEGVRFRSIDLGLTTAELSDQAHLRNLVAYKCFGVEDLRPFEQTPFGPRAEGYGLIERLRRDNRLTDCEVPLAFVSWRDEGIQYVDNWSVRRRIVKPSANGEWDYTIGDRRRAEAEAMFLQFQEHIEELRTKLTAPQSVVGTQYFRYLPAAGVLTTAGFGVVQGFDYATFFQSKTYRAPVFIEGARVEALLRDSLAYPPVDLLGKEMIWLYFVRENIQEIDSGSLTRPQPYLIFVNGHMPFVGEARFDLSRWDYSNYV